MKLIRCNECGDVVRLIHTKWRVCECGKSGGQYNDDLMTATVGGKCVVFGIANPFFSKDYPHFKTEKLKQKFREKMGYGYGGKCTSDCWMGEFRGDEQIMRIKSPKGPKLKIRIFKTGSFPNKNLLFFEDKRKFTMNVNTIPRMIVVDAVPSSFKGKSKK